MGQTAGLKVQTSSHSRASSHEFVRFLTPRDHNWRLPKVHPGAQVRAESSIDGIVNKFARPSKRKCVAPAYCGDKCVKEIRFDAPLESRGEHTLAGGGGLGLGHWLCGQHCHI